MRLAVILHLIKTSGMIGHTLTHCALVPAIPRLSINTQLEAIKPLAQAKIDMSAHTTRVDDPLSLTPTSASASDEGDESRLSFLSQTSSNDVSALENDIENASDQKQSTTTHSVLSIWTGASSNGDTPAGSNPWASIGSASAVPLSPLASSARKSRFSQFFSAMKDVGGSSGSPKSPFFPDGLSGGLISAMSDIKIQQQKMGEDVKGYITSHYASPSGAVIPQPGTKRWTQYIASIQAAMDAMPMTQSGNPLDLSQPSTIAVGHKEQSRLTGNRRPIQKPYDISNTQNTSTVHDPRAAPFIPRGTTTIKNLEQVVEEHEEQKSLTFTRPRSSWDQVPNWRSNGKAKCGMWRKPSAAGHVNKPRETHPRESQPLTTGPLVFSAPRVVLPPSSQALTASQTSSTALVAIGKRDTTRRTFEPFRPMNAVLNPDAYKQPLSEDQIAFRVKHGISLNYHGNHENTRNISAKIPDQQNCAVWITNLPSKCTTKDLLQALMHHRPGRVWATHINAPEEPKHRHAAAKVVFYHPAEAKHLLNLARRPGILIQDRRISAIYNKQRVAAQEYTYPTSRALEIRGDKAIVNEKFLRSLFENHFKFEDEAVEVLAEFEDTRVIEWRFGSMRAQAGSAYKLLERMYPCVHIRYATDPCAQYMTIPGQKQFDQLAAPAQHGFVPQGSSGAPGGPGKMP